LLEASFLGHRLSHNSSDSINSLENRSRVGQMDKVQTKADFQDPKNPPKRLTFPQTKSLFNHAKSTKKKIKTMKQRKIGKNNKKNSIFQLYF
jgi:hypothetical protein